MKRKAHAIIMRRTAYGDADWIVTFFDREYGRLSGIARSARSSVKRFGGALEPGTLSEITCTARNGSGLVRLDEARVLASPNGVLKSLERIAAMARALELSLAFLQEGQPVPDKFDLLAGWISRIALGDPTASESLMFELEWLKLSGFGPGLDACSVCGSSVSAETRGAWSFDVERGGLVCHSCALGIGRRIRLTEGVLGALRGVKGADTDSECTSAACEVVARYVEHVVGRPLKAWSVV